MATPGASVSEAEPQMSSASAALQGESRRIRLLPPHLINQIAAGEVVERPASVIKELVENALDAGATRVDIEASAGGRDLRVADNGSGMSAEDAQLAFINHATSKIWTEADLTQIETLGFRGEALASIAAVSRLTCYTRRSQDATGCRVRLRERLPAAAHTDESLPVPVHPPTEVQPAGCAVGTVMEVQELFYSTPARLKFLKRPQTEMAAIEETVSLLALSRPEVAFQLHLNGQSVLKTPGNGQLISAIQAVYQLKKLVGETSNADLIPVAYAEDGLGLSLSGYVASPGIDRLHRASRKGWALFVNGRSVRCHLFSKALESALEGIMPPGRYPLSVLFLNLPTTAVDVNVHPTKKEVRYAQPNPVFQFVRHGLKTALAEGYPRAGAQPSGAQQASGCDQEASFAKTGLPPHFAENDPLQKQNQQARNQQERTPQGLWRELEGVEKSSSAAAAPWNSTAQQSLALQATAPLYVLGNAAEEAWDEQNHPPLTASQESSQTLPKALSPTLPQTAEAEFQSASSALAEDPRRAEGEDASRWKSKDWKVIGQLFNTYILLETRQGLMVVDQHIASERACFERLSQQQTNGGVTAQPLLSPLMLAACASQKALLQEHQAALQQVGFELTVPEEEPSIYLTAIPLLYPDRRQPPAADQFRGILARLEAGDAVRLDTTDLIATLACHSAVRAGDVLTAQQMDGVVEDWLACRLPWTCPHGRPIAHTIRAEELHRFFHRSGLPVNAAVNASTGSY
ncbi:MAG: DNA mismatch repair endonuclease MutL [Candidatus Melainabacteria bacterium]|nr:DNA mismatch repair endonuclease MutL [Candidatus Melainabacteria bacterium]